jgi:uncharacterized membrane protein YgaE (UPF0421/DUF939 family)
MTHDKIIAKIRKKMDELQELINELHALIDFQKDAKELSQWEKMLKMEKK